MPLNVPRGVDSGCALIPVTTIVIELFPSCNLKTKILVSSANTIQSGGLITSDSTVGMISIWYLSHISSCVFYCDRFRLPTFLWSDSADYLIQALSLADKFHRLWVVLPAAPY